MFGCVGNGLDFIFSFGKISVLCYLQRDQCHIPGNTGYSTAVAADGADDSRHGSAVSGLVIIRNIAFLAEIPTLCQISFQIGMVRDPAVDHAHPNTGRTGGNIPGILYGYLP